MYYTISTLAIHGRLLNSEKNVDQVLFTGTIIIIDNSQQ